METVSFDLEIRGDQDPSRPAVIRCTALLREIAGKRRIYEGLWDGREVVVKVFDGRLRGRLGSRREIRGLTLLQQRGISAPRILLKGRDLHGGTALVLEKIPTGQDLAAFFEECRAEQEKRAMYRQWIDFVAGMHEKGIAQTDLHTGNFMTAAGTLYALDPAAMRFHFAPLSMKQGLDQLANLICTMPFEDRYEPQPFLRQYCEARGRSCSEEDLLVLRKYIRKAWDGAVRRTLKRTLRDNSRYFFLREGDLSGMFRRKDWTEESAREFVREIDRRMEEGQILKRGNTCFVSRVRIGELDAAVKRYNYKGLLHTLRVTIKGSRARKCWLEGHRLEQLGIACAVPLAFVERRKGGLVWQSYLASEFLEGPLLYEAADRSAAIRKAEQLMEQMGQFRLTHRDMKPANLLFHNGRATLIDLDALCRHRAGFYFRYRQRKMITLFKSRLPAMPQGE
jgi:tRNA A-37 threonylcarbamoyl transferase component Bud32